MSALESFKEMKEVVGFQGCTFNRHRDKRSRPYWWPNQFGYLSQPSIYCIFGKLDQWKNSTNIHFWLTDL